MNIEVCEGAHAANRDLDIRNIQNKLLSLELNELLWVSLSRMTQVPLSSH